MKSQAIMILSIVGVVGTGAAAMAVNSDVLSSGIALTGMTSSSAVEVARSADLAPQPARVSPAPLLSPSDPATPDPETGGSAPTPGGDSGAQRDEPVPTPTPSSPASTAKVPTTSSDSQSHEDSSDNSGISATKARAKNDD